MKTRLCNYYNTRQGCRKGEQCGFIHECSNCHAEDNHPVRECKSRCKHCGKGGHVEERCIQCHRCGERGHHKNSCPKRYCDYYNTSDGCQNGDDCMFIHECMNCKEEGHCVTDCNVPCKHCGKGGHVEKRCIRCRICRIQGHHMKDCHLYMCTHCGTTDYFNHSSKCKYNHRE